MRKTYFLFAFLLLSACLVHRVQSSQPADDFSEFDEFDEPEIKIDNPELNEPNDDLKPQQQQPPPEDHEFSEEQQQPEIGGDSPNDEDGEVTVEEEQPDEDEAPVKKERKPFEPIKLSSLPLHLRNNWSSYYIEIGIVCAIVLYFINFFAGSSTNQKLAENFWNASLELLQSHFLLVGDDGSKEPDPKRTYVKDSDSNFVLWCTGRFGYDCCIVELNLNKRQDLMSTLWSMIKPSADQITVKIFLKDDAMDSFVFCLANKKGGFKTVKEYNDVVTFCTQRRTIEKHAFLNDNFVLLNEIGDVTSLVFDNQLLGLLASSPELINFIHISDQFSGPKPGEQDAQPTKAPTVKRVLTLSFNCPKGIGSSYDMEQMKELLSMSLSLAERVKRFKLKKDMKAKAVANRKKVDEFYEKLSNAEKQQAAQQKKEEKRRQEKEKYIDANDEFKLRKFEEKQYKKDMKKKFKPKMKAIRAN